MITDPSHLLAARLLWIAGALAIWLWLIWIDRVNPKAQKSSFFTNFFIMIFWPTSAIVIIAYTTYLFVNSRKRKH